MCKLGNYYTQLHEDNDMNIWYENLRGEYHTGAIKQLQKENDTVEHLEKKSPSWQEFQ